MDRVVNDPGTRALFYEAQGEAAQRHLAGAPVILDVGCGAALQYPRPPGCRVIELDLSIGLLRQNKDLDVAVYGSATALPIADRSVDRVVCFYAVHHFVGDPSPTTEARSSTRSLSSEGYCDRGESCWCSICLPGGSSGGRSAWRGMACDECSGLASICSSGARIIWSGSRPGNSADPPGWIGRSSGATP